MNTDDLKRESVACPHCGCDLKYNANLFSGGFDISSGWYQWDSYHLDHDTDKFVCDVVSMAVCADCEREMRSSGFDGIESFYALRGSAGAVSNWRKL